MSTTARPTSSVMSATAGGRAGSARSRQARAHALDRERSAPFQRSKRVLARREGDEHAHPGVADDRVHDDEDALQLGGEARGRWPPPAGSRCRRSRWPPARPSPSRRPAGSQGRNSEEPDQHAEDDPGHARRHHHQRRAPQARDGLELGGEEHQGQAGRQQVARDGAVDRALGGEEARGGGQHGQEVGPHQRGQAVEERAAARPGGPAGRPARRRRRGRRGRGAGPGSRPRDRPHWGRRAPRYREAQ